MDYDEASPTELSTLNMIGTPHDIVLEEDRLNGKLNDEYSLMIGIHGYDQVIDISCRSYEIELD
jgi:hypothetical protein